MTTQRDEWPAAILLAVLAAVIYLPTVRNGYAFDDVPVVRDNPVVQEGRYGAAVAAPYWPARPGLYAASNWRPLAMLSLALEQGFFGFATPMIHHAVNALFHGLVVLALFPLARRLAGPGWPALAACALFAVHPAHTEAVAPVVGRTDLLAALGALVALDCFLRHRDDAAGGRWLALGAAAYAFGLAGKESAAPVLLLLPAADWLLFGRRLRDLAGRPALAYLPFIAVAAVYVAARLAVLGDTAFHHANAPGYSVSQRLVFAAHNAVVSFGLLVAPTRFHHIMTTLPADAPFTYPDPTGLAALAFVAGGLVIGLGWLALVRPAPRGAFLWLSAVVTWLPTSGLLPAGAGVSLRFLLLPTAFFACGLALGLARLAGARPALARPAAVAVALLCLAAAGLSIWRTTQWRNNQTFYTAVLAEAPDCYTAQVSLGTAYAMRREPDFDEARKHYLEAIRIVGDSKYAFDPMLTLAVSWEFDDSGRRYGAGANLDEATRLYHRLMELDPTRFEPHLNLAIILDHEGRSSEAAEQFRRALELDPDNPQRSDIERRIRKLEQ